ncbi:MAG: serine/threonine protein kinase [Verrucomicrobiaceae bacterium]|nr:serine/threonine protein kinase [Verrucomicrobiaceae bacterium]
MTPDDQPTVPTRPPDPSRATQPGVWTAPSVEELQAKLPQYEVLEILGRGGMGAVYKARQKSLKRLVAIKILPLGMAGDEFKFVERFQNEAQTMAAMNHPAIVSVYDFGETPDGLLYFVMEFVDGTDVHKMIQASGRLSGEYALSVTAHVCDALSYAHKRGVIHRDIKPANILIDQEGHIKVADFGLAKMHDPAQTSGLTKSNMAMGTPDYVAPEVLSPGMVADHRADIYAVGVMLYQMLTGEVPRGMFKLPSQKGIGSDERFDVIICKAMEQEREERFQSASDVRRALDEIATTPLPKNDGTGIVPAKNLSLAQAGRPDTSASSQPQLPPNDASAKTAVLVPAAKRSPATMKLAIGGIAVMLSVAGVFMFGSKPRPDTTAAVSAASALPSANPQTPSAATTAAGKSIDLLAIIDLKRDTIAGEWSRDGGDLLVKPGTTDTTGKGTPRIQLPYQPPEEYDFEIEFTPETHQDAVYQILSAYQHSFAWVLDANLKAGRKAGFDRIDGQLISGRTNGTTMRPKFLTNGQRHVSTVEVRKTGVRGLLDGEVLVSYGNSSDSFKAFDSSPNEAARDTLHLGLAVRDRAVRIHKITVREISGAGKVDAAVPALPLLTTANWKDVTATLRQSVAKKTGYTVDAAGVTRTAGAPIGDTMVMGPSERDRAVRVRYVGQAQVSLWFKSGAASAFVLAARDQTLFKHQKQKVGESDSIVPPVTHPASFDPTQPHELTVAVQGTVVRAWLDGRHVGEAENAELRECSLAIVPMKNSTVQKVEVAELSTASSSPEGAQVQWQPIFNQPTEFHGDSRDVEFRDGATFIKARTFLAPADPAIVGIRSTMRFLTGGDRTGSLTLRSTEGAKYGEEDFALTAYIAPKGTSLVVKMRDRPAGIDQLGRHDFPLTPALKEGDLFTFELRAENKKFIVSINGREVGSVDDKWTGATRRLGITPSVTEMTEFRDVAVRTSASPK